MGHNQGMDVWLPGVIFVAIMLPIAYALVWAFDHYGWFGHEKDTWVPGVRLKRLQASVDDVNARLTRIEERLERGSPRPDA
jgi:hypothetical protein